MKYIAHRINSIEELMNVPAEYGVELDLRDDREGGLYLSHDPFKGGEPFEEYLACYHHGIMIINVKSERVEFKALEFLRKYGIEDFFFLDSSFPMLYTLSEQGERRLALRFSEFEGLETLRKCAGRAEWVWVDCFRRFCLDVGMAEEIHNLGYRLCAVSPELQGRPEEIDEYAAKAATCGIDAVCAKLQYMEKWNQDDGR